MVFSLILLPSWGGMINGIMTCRAPGTNCVMTILRFLIVSLSFYGMSTFEAR